MAQRSNSSEVPGSWRGMQDQLRAPQRKNNGENKTFDTKHDSGESAAPTSAAAASCGAAGSRPMPGARPARTGGGGLRSPPQGQRNRGQKPEAPQRERGADIGRGGTCM